MEAVATRQGTTARPLFGALRSKVENRPPLVGPRGGRVTTKPDRVRCRARRSAAMGAMKSLPPLFLLPSSPKRSALTRDSTTSAWPATGAPAGWRRPVQPSGSGTTAAAASAARFQPEARCAACSMAWSVASGIQLGLRTTGGGSGSASPSIGRRHAPAMGRHAEPTVRERRSLGSRRC